MAAGGFLGNRGGVDMRARPCISFDEFLFRHDLEQLENGRVPDCLIAGLLERVMHFAHGAGAVAPENAENRQLGVGGTNRGAVGHGANIRSASYLSIRSASYIDRLDITG